MAHKPLPQVPPTATLPRLTIEHRDHLKRIIEHTIELRGLDPVWVAPLHNATQSLAHWMAKGEWTRGVLMERKLWKSASATIPTETPSTLTNDATPKASTIVTSGKFTDEKDELYAKRLHRLFDLVQLSDTETLAKHFLLTVAPATWPSSEEEGYDLIIREPDCFFHDGAFYLPYFKDTESVERGHGGTILCGLDSSPEHNAVVIGGSFELQGVPNEPTFKTLLSVLNIATYTVLSIELELAFLRDAGATLNHIPTSSKLSNTSYQPPVAISHSTNRHKVKDRVTKASSGIWSYLTKRTEHLIQRSRTISGPHDRTEATSRPSLDSIVVRQNNLPSLSNEPKSFIALAQEVRRNNSLLTTSPGVKINSPVIVSELAEREAKENGMRIDPSAQVGLSSLLGWNEARRQLITLDSFAQHQAITLLYSEKVSAGNSETETSSSTCLRGHWKTYNFWSAVPEEDYRLGEWVQMICSSATEPCAHTDCKAKRGEHELEWIHNRTRISAKVSTTDEFEGLCMWASCSVCSEATDRQAVAEGTLLLSFGKFLELLIYSTFMEYLSPAICEHTAKGNLSTKHNIVRHFSAKSAAISFTISSIQDVFDILIPRVQIIPPAQRDNEGSVSDRWEKDAQEHLKSEISVWWSGVKEHLSKLEDFLAAKEGPQAYDSQKKLPAIPPPEATDDTPKQKLSALPNISNTDTGKSNSSGTVISQTTSNTISSTTSTPLVLLSHLKQAFTATEQSLYMNLRKTPSSSVNDVRRLFQSSAKAATKRLAAWQEKHAPDAPREIERVNCVEPEWWNNTCHALPGGNVLVREGEWASVIAFTLSSTDYLRELQMMSSDAGSTTGATIGGENSTKTSTFSTSESNTVTTSATSSIVIDHVSVTSLSTPSISSPSPSLASFMANVTALASSRTDLTKLDPDEEKDAEKWHQSEEWSSQISRKEHPKDGSNILSFRGVMKGGPSFDATGLSSKLTQIGGSASRLVKALPPSAYSKPAVELVSTTADGTITSNTADTATIVQKLLKDAEVSMEAEDSQFISSIPSVTPSPVGTDARRGNNLSITSSDSGTTVKANDSRIFHSIESSTLSLAPPVPSKIIKRDIPPPPVEKDGGYPSASPSGLSSAVGSLTTHLANAMRYVLSAGSAENLSDRSGGSSPHHGLLSTNTTGESPEIDAKPHIKYEWTIGKRVKFSCTVYYAKQFDSLRRRCGVDKLIIQSLTRSENWAAEGGKSKSNFWKTSDDRFIIKTLVNNWNVNDMQVLIDLGPSYFRYMDSTAHKPSVLAKLLGFYTVEIKNIETGSVQSKADLLVMENLFFERTVTQTFDLKGIQGRKVKPSSGKPNKILFDSEWIEGQKKELLLVHPHAKAILQEAIRADADFLAKSRIMDYSLLLGIDLEDKQITCGLVDTIGSYTFAKTLEYKAKQNIKKDVTVIPPNEYQERFVKSMESYFVACPDKWSLPSTRSSVRNRVPDVF